MTKTELLKWIEDCTYSVQFLHINKAAKGIHKQVVRDMLSELRREGFLRLDIVPSKRGQPKYVYTVTDRGYNVIVSKKNIDNWTFEQLKYLHTNAFMLHRKAA